MPAQNLLEPSKNVRQFVICYVFLEFFVDTTLSKLSRFSSFCCCFTCWSYSIIMKKSKASKNCQIDWEKSKTGIASIKSGWHQKLLNYLYLKLSNQVLLKVNLISILIFSTNLLFPHEFVLKVHLLYIENRFSFYGL